MFPFFSNLPSTINCVVHILHVLLIRPKHAVFVPYYTSQAPSFQEAVELIASQFSHHLFLRDAGVYGIFNIFYKHQSSKASSLFIMPIYNVHSTNIPFTPHNKRNDVAQYQCSGSTLLYFWCFILPVAIRYWHDRVALRRKGSIIFHNAVYSYPWMNCD